MEWRDVFSARTHGTWAKALVLDDDHSCQDENKDTQALQLNGVSSINGHTLCVSGKRILSSFISNERSVPLGGSIR